MNAYKKSLMKWYNPKGWLMLSTTSQAGDNNEEMLDQIREYAFNCYSLGIPLSDALYKNFQQVLYVQDNDQPSFFSQNSHSKSMPTNSVEFKAHMRPPFDIEEYCIKNGSKKDYMPVKLKVLDLFTTAGKLPLSQLREHTKVLICNPFLLTFYRQSKL